MYVPDSLHGGDFWVWGECLMICAENPVCLLCSDFTRSLGIQSCSHWGQTMKFQQINLELMGFGLDPKAFITVT